jgi:hypothetical protein
MIYVSLVENAAKSSHCDFTMFGDDGGVGDPFGLANKLDVTALLAVLCEAGCFEPPLYFAKR